MTEKEKIKQPVVEEVGPYYPGMVIASKEMAESSKGGISTFNNQTGKTDKEEGKKTTS